MSEVEGAEQLDIFGGSVPFPTVELRAVRKGQRGGSAEAAKIPQSTEKLIEMLSAFSLCSHSNEPLWDDRLAEIFTDDHPGTVAKRRLALERAGLVEEIPGVMAKTRRNVSAMTFRLTDKGRQVLQEWRTAR